MNGFKVIAPKHQIRMSSRIDPGDPECYSKCFAAHTFGVFGDRAMCFAGDANDKRECASVTIGTAIGCRLACLGKPIMSVPHPVCIASEHYIPKGFTVFQVPKTGSSCTIKDKGTPGKLYPIVCDQYNYCECTCGNYKITDYKPAVKSRQTTNCFPCCGMCNRPVVPERCSDICESGHLVTSEVEILPETMAVLQIFENENRNIPKTLGQSFSQKDVINNANSNSDNHESDSQTDNNNEEFEIQRPNPGMDDSEFQLQRPNPDVDQNSDDFQLQRPIPDLTKNMNNKNTDNKNDVISDKKADKNEL